MAKESHSGLEARCPPDASESSTSGHSSPNSFDSGHLAFIRDDQNSDHDSANDSDNNEASKGKFGSILKSTQSGDRTASSSPNPTAESIKCIPVTGVDHRYGTTINELAHETEGLIRVRSESPNNTSISNADCDMDIDMPDAGPYSSSGTSASDAPTHSSMHTSLDGRTHSTMDTASDFGAHSSREGSITDIPKYPDMNGASVAQTHSSGEANLIDTWIHAGLDSTPVAQPHSSEEASLTDTPKHPDMNSTPVAEPRSSVGTSFDGKTHSIIGSETSSSPKHSAVNFSSTSHATNIAKQSFEPSEHLRPSRSFALPAPGSWIISNCLRAEGSNKSSKRPYSVFSRAGPIFTARKVQQKPPFELFSSLEDEKIDDSPQARSPWDLLKRTPKRLKDLDLNHSYEWSEHRYERKWDSYESLDRPLGAHGRSHKRHTKKINTLINDLDKLPPNWSSMEPDLQPYDWKRQIQRCKERIEENVLPGFFKYRLAQYKRAVSSYTELSKKEPDDLGWYVLRRLDTLERLKAHQEKSGDSKKHGRNIDAVMNAYRSKRLKWNEDGINLVTYWRGGQQLCQPRPFDWDELEAVQQANSTKKSFWVEGILGSGPESSYVAITATPSMPRSHMLSYTAAVRLADPVWHSQWWVPLEFIYDTGSSSMNVYEDDMVAMMGRWLSGMPRPNNKKEPINDLVSLGASLVETTNGIMSMEMYTVEVCILDKKGKRICPWTRVTCGVKPGNYDPLNGVRSDGPWLRHLFYTSSTPSRNELKISSTRKGH